MEAGQAGTVQHIHLRIHHVWGISLTSFISFWPSASGPRLGPSAAQSVFTQLVPLPGDRWQQAYVCDASHPHSSSSCVNTDPVRTSTAVIFAFSHFEWTHFLQFVLGLVHTERPVSACAQAHRRWSCVRVGLSCVCVGDPLVVFQLVQTLISRRMTFPSAAAFLCVLCVTASHCC